MHDLIRNATYLSGAPSDGDAVGATAVLVGVAGTSLVVGPLGRRELVRAAAMLGGLFLDFLLRSQFIIIYYDRNCRHLTTRTLAKLVQIESAMTFIEASTNSATI